MASNQTWYDYLKRERSRARYMGLDQEFISMKELADPHVGFRCQGKNPSLSSSLRGRYSSMT